MVSPSISIKTSPYLGAFSVRKEKCKDREAEAHTLMPLLLLICAYCLYRVC